MSKLKPQKEYEKTAAYKFWAWLEGKKDPYIDRLEMKEQKEFKESKVAAVERVIEHEKLHEKIYDMEKNKEQKFFRIFYRICAIVLCVVVIAALILCASYLPEVGNANNPTVNETMTRYLEKGMEETGVVNTVTGMILNYRGFDTFGETCVLFIASSCVMILLMISEDKLRANETPDFEPKDDLILQTIAKLLVPILMIFGFYVIVNGHLSPGGGFSGGAIIGSGLILYASAFGHKKISQFFNEHVYKCIKVTALILYGCIMTYHFYTGANGIDNLIPMGTVGNIISAGMIFYINLFVGSEVACTIYAFYALFKRGGL